MKSDPHLAVLCFTVSAVLKVPFNAASVILVNYLFWNVLYMLGRMSNGADFKYSVCEISFVSNTIYCILTLNTNRRIK